MDCPQYRWVQIVLMIKLCPNSDISYENSECSVMIYHTTLKINSPQWIARAIDPAARTNRKQPPEEATATILNRQKTTVVTNRSSWTRTQVGRTHLSQLKATVVVPENRTNTPRGRPEWTKATEFDTSANRFGNTQLVRTRKVRGLWFVSLRNKRESLSYFLITIV